MKKLLLIIFLICNIINISAEENKAKDINPQEDENTTKADTLPLNSINTPLILPENYLSSCFGYRIDKNLVNTIEDFTQNNPTIYGNNIHLNNFKFISNISDSIFENLFKFKYTFSPNWQWNFITGFTWSSMNDSEFINEVGEYYFPVHKPVYSVNFNLLEVPTTTSISDWAYLPNIMEDPKLITPSLDFNIKYRHNENWWNLFSFANKLSFYTYSDTMNNIPVYFLKTQEFFDFTLLTGVQLTEDTKSGLLYSSII